MIFRRCKLNGDPPIWHWRRECEHWPIMNYTEFKTMGPNRPGYGKVCSKCERIQREVSKYEARP